MASTTLMFQEAGSSSLLALQQLAANRERAAELGALLRRKKPRAVITTARGSSDHATTFARYLIETHLGILTSSLAPSISSVYEAKLDRGFPVLALAQHDETLPGLVELAGRFAERGASVLLAGAEAPGATLLPSIAAHPAIEPVLQIQSFYRMAAQLSVARGFDPDRPPHLNKVTNTL